MHGTNVKKKSNFYISGISYAQNVLQYMCVFQFVKVQVSNAENSCEILLRFCILVAQLRPDDG